MKVGQTTAPRRCGHLCVAKMLKALTEGDQTVEDLVEVSGLCDVTVRAYVLTFRKEKAIHVSGWDVDRRGRVTRPAYSIGEKKDVVRKVVPINGAERARKYRERKRISRIMLALAA